MKAILFFLVAILAMAAAQRGSSVHFVDNSDQVQVVDNIPGYNTNGVQVVDINPDSDTNWVNVVENSDVPSSSNNDGQIVILNPDPFFSQPSNGPSNGGYETPSIEPAFVGNKPAGKPYPYDSLARGGK